MSEFNTLDWETDEILRRPSELDARVDQLLAATEPEPSEYSVSTPSSYFSTPSSFSNDVTSPTPTEELMASPKSKKPKVIPWNQVKIKKDHKTSSTSMAALVPPTVPKLRPKAKTKWESPEEKIKKYEMLQNKYFIQKTAYEERFKKMKTMVRNIKATPNQLLPPREEAINLFEQVSISKVPIN